MSKKSNDINAQMFYALKVSEISRVPFLFMSAPGMGKTTSVEMFAKIRGYKMVQLRGNSTSEQEVMGYDVVDTTPGSRSTIRTRPGWYCELLEAQERGQKTLLFLDEITTCPEHVQSALLHLIFERRVGTEDIPDDTLIVSAGNYSQCLSNAFSLIPPLMNRFCIFNIVPEQDDLKTFLSKYDGSISGSRIDFMAEKIKQLTALDSRTDLSDVDKDNYNKIAEYFERGVYETTRMLMTTGEKVVDLKVTDMQNIYTDTENDATLKGFVTMRTLNYLRDVTIAAFQLYGKEGIQSNNYRRMVEGLVGIGLSRDRSGDVKTTIITKDYYDSMTSVVADIEKMKNKKLPEYSKFIDDRTKGKEKSEFTPEEVNVLNNKFKELKADVELKSVDRPIDAEIIERLCTSLVFSSRACAAIRLSKSDQLHEKISPEELAKLITRWNGLADLLETIGTMVTDSGRSYKDNTKNAIQRTIEDMRKDSFKLSSLHKIMSAEVPAAASILPKPHTSYVK